MNDLFTINKKKILLTGASGGLGFKLSRYLISQGATIIAIDKKKKIYKNENFKFFNIDITSEQQLINLFDNLNNLNLKPDIIINNAGIDVPPTKSRGNNLFDTRIEDWELTFDVNVKAIFLISKIFGKHLIKVKGNMINIGSIYGNVSPDQKIYKGINKSFEKPSAYSASKGALVNLTKHLAVLWADKGVNINLVSFAGIFNHQDKKFLKNYCDRIPIGRMAKESDYFGIIHYLCSKASKYTTGSNVIVDGGWTSI